MKKPPQLNEAAVIRGMKNNVILVEDNEHRRDWKSFKKVKFPQMMRLLPMIHSRTKTIAF